MITITIMIIIHLFFIPFILKNYLYSLLDFFDKIWSFISNQLYFFLFSYMHCFFFFNIFYISFHLLTPHLLYIYIFFLFYFFPLTKSRTKMWKENSKLVTFLRRKNTTTTTKYNINEVALKTDTTSDKISEKATKLQRRVLKTIRYNDGKTTTTTR